MKLKTKRLILRYPDKKDILDVVENINNINVARWLSQVPYPYSKKHAKIWLNNSKKEKKKKRKEKFSFYIELKLTHKVIGGISLKNIDYANKVCDVGYWLGEPFWRQGYGTEALNKVLEFAFKKLKLRRIEALVFVGNPSSGKLLEKCGFIKEGLKRKASVSKSTKEIVDQYIYGLLYEDFFK